MIVMQGVSWHARYKQKQTIFNLIQDQCKQSPPTLSGDPARSSYAAGNLERIERDELTNKPNYQKKKNARECLTLTKRRFRIASQQFGYFC